MKKKGFTLIELLVVIAIIAMLLAILMPALSKVKKIAQRVICGTNLKGLGTANVVYANDYSDSYAVQGRRGSHTLSGRTAGWNLKTKDWNTASTITVGASLYLLVREADVSTKSFICPSSDQREFSGKHGITTNPQPDLVDLWDFGHPDEADKEGPGKTVSYAYHQPYAANSAGAGGGARGTYAASGSVSASFALMADRNPWMDRKITRGTPSDTTYMSMVALLGLNATSPAPNTDTADWSQIQPRWTLQQANAQSHDREGQNVLFGDGHNEWTTRSDVGIQNDNIYTRWDVNVGVVPTTVKARRQGVAVGAIANVIADGTTAPRGTEDSVLVNDIGPQ